MVDRIDIICDGKPYVFYVNLGDGWTAEGVLRGLIEAVRMQGVNDAGWLGRDYLEYLDENPEFQALFMKMCGAYDPTPDDRILIL